MGTIVTHAVADLGGEEGFNGFNGTPLLKGCLRKYYAQTYYNYVHCMYPHWSYTN